jgi:methionine--tRNA ligase beta chain
MKSHKNIYYKIYKWENLLLALKRARKGKTKKDYVIKFEENIIKNLQDLQFELMTKTYNPKPLKTFILRDPKTRKISKSHFRDRIIHHALCNIIEPIFQKTFIYNSCANQKGKGNIFAIKRFDKFKRKITRNGKQKGWFNNNQVKGYCLKADIKHYFEEVNHKILINIVKKKIKDKNTIQLITKILKNYQNKKKGMPLGNLTSQFFANIYLNELDYFTKHKLKTKYYIRYVDDFIILSSNKGELIMWKKEIKYFLKNKLSLQLHSQKSNIIKISQGIDFVGFRIFCNFRLLRKRNIRKMKEKIKLYEDGKITQQEFKEIFQGWNAYAKWAKIYNLQYFIITMEGITQISYEDFTKLDLRVAEIQNTEDIEGADKLYKLTVSIGKEARTICAGIKQFYSHEDLKGKQIIIIANLEPRKLKGIESQGMLLAALNKDHTKVSLLTPDQNMNPGDKIS